MDLQQLIGLAINASMFVIVFTLGLRATMQDATYLFQHPALFARSLLSMNVIMLGVAVLIAVVFNPATEIKIALAALALSPVPPILPSKQMKSGGSQDYTIGLLADVSMASIIVVPLGILLLDVFFNVRQHVGMMDVAKVVFMSILLPLFAGILVHQFAPAFSQRIVKPLALAGTILLVLACVPVLVVAWPEIWKLVGDGLIFGLLAFGLVGLAVGHWLGGPDPDDRTVLALATAARHPGVAIGIAAIAAPDAMRVVLVVVLFHLLFGMLISAPYARWRRREHAAHEGRTA
jgi:BASS family bile acid:Na+ symporter